MSIQVTVNSNPLCINRSRVLLTDVEQAKKNEWNRRRKLRLQQVRQQSRDLASNLRRKCNDEKKLYQKQECEEYELELREWQAKQLQKLQNEYDKCIAAIGTAHKTAVCELGGDENLKEKSELREALAKARGALARERAKINAINSVNPANIPAKSPKSKVKSICKLTSTASDFSKVDRKQTLLKINLKTPIKSFSRKVFSPHKKRDGNKSDPKAKIPTESTIPSPGMTRQPQHQKRVKLTTAAKRNLSSSPTSKTANIEDISACEDSDESNATWPPRSARVTKMPIFPQKVRLYNHDERVCKEYIKPSKSVTHLEKSFQNAMEKYIEEEQKAEAKQTEHDAIILKKSAVRGQKALSKERLEKEFKSLSRQLTEVDKHQRIARIFEFPYPIKETKHTENKTLGKSPLKGRCSSSKAPDDVYQEINKCFEIGALERGKKGNKTQDQVKKDYINENPFTLKKLIKDLEKERDLLLNSTLEKSSIDNEDRRNSNVPEISPEKSAKSAKEPTEQNFDADGTNRSEELRNQETVQLETASSENDSEGKTEKKPHPIEVNVITKSLCDCCETCTCQQENPTNLIDKQTVKKNISLVSNSTLIEKDENIKVKQQLSEKLKKEKEVKSKKTRKNMKQNIRISSERAASAHIKETENECAEIDRYTTDNGIKITVTVTEKNANKNEENQVSRSEVVSNESEISTAGQTGYDNDMTSSSSSAFCSPPSQLSPTHQHILNSILLKMCLKNNNPKLHKYIKRLLSMNKVNIDTLPVSSASEISIHSDLFPDTQIDSATGTSYLEGIKKPSVHKNIVFSETTSQTGIKKNILKPKIEKKIFQSNTSSEESSNGENIPVLKSAGKDINSSKFLNLADEYTLRLKELIEMLNQSSLRNRLSETRGNNSSSYICPPNRASPLIERTSAYSDLLLFEDSNDYLFDNEEMTTNKKSLNQKHINTDDFDDQENSSFTRKNHISLGLPFELLPKPFTLSEEPASKEHLPKHKPPVASNKYRVEGLLPHELSAIPEVSTQIGVSEQEILSNSFRQKSSEDNASDEYLSDSDISEVSSIRPATNKRIERMMPVQTVPVAGPSRLYEQSDTSSLSILSHMTNESLIDIRPDVSGNDVNSFLESPAEYIEEVFRSLGIGWTLSTLRKTRQSRQRDTTSTSTTSSGSNNHATERSRPKSISIFKGCVRHSHSTPKKSVVSNNSISTDNSDELRKKFKALKNERLSLTPPDITLTIPVFGGLNSSDSSTLLN